MTRQTKTPRQRAEEALAVEERRVERLTDQWERVRDEADRLSKERDAAVARLNHLRQHPDLKPTTSSTDPTGDPA